MFACLLMFGLILLVLLKHISCLKFSDESAPYMDLFYHSFKYYLYYQTSSGHNGVATYQMIPYIGRTTST